MIYVIILENEMALSMVDDARAMADAADTPSARVGLTLKCLMPYRRAYGSPWRHEWPVAYHYDEEIDDADYRYFGRCKQGTMGDGATRCALSRRFLTASPPAAGLLGHRA